MDKLFECKCGCTQFINETPHQFRNNDVYNWASFGLKFHAGNAPVLICLNCNRMTIPPLSFAGRSRLDPNVQAYGDLMTWVEKHNQRIEDQESFNQCGIDPKALDAYIEQMNADGGEVPVGKLDKQTMPTKEETFGPNKQKNQEPRNKTKSKPAKPKVKKQKNPSITSKDTVDV